MRVMHAAFEPPVVESASPFPLVVVSHCTDCLRFGYFVAAERLAGRGFVVAAPDHVQNTLYNYRAGNSVGVDMNDFLLTRSNDILGIIDTFLKADADVVPTGIRGKIDAARIGMFGHSYGAITTALTSGDPRVRAVAFLAMVASTGENLPYAGDDLAKRIERKPFSKPALFVLAQEDTIGLLGLNDIIRQNYRDYPVPSWLATLSDSGHYSVCTLCGLIPEIANCSGGDLRASPLLEPFTYLDVDYANSLTASLLTSFFEAQLVGEASTSMEAIAAAAPKGTLTVEHHP
jgi:dienelactone hydrolase